MKCYIWDGEEWNNLSALADLLGVSTSAMQKHINMGKTRTSQIRHRKDITHNGAAPIPFEYPKYSRMSHEKMRSIRINAWKLAMETDPHPDELMDKLLDRISDM